MGFWPIRARAGSYLYFNYIKRICYEKVHAKSCACMYFKNSIGSQCMQKNAITEPSERIAYQLHAVLGGGGGGGGGVLPIRGGSTRKGYLFYASGI